MSAVRRDVVILTCAISAGIHGALVPEHLEEGMGAGGGFIASTVLLAALAIWLTIRPDRAALTAALLLFAGLIASYVLAVTTGFPVLHPDVEPVDGLALFTKAVEAVGIAAAAALLGPAPRARLHLHAKGI
jgi:hypothetical protein